MNWINTPAGFFLILPAFLAAQNNAPVLQNLSATANWSSKTLTLQYGVSDAENDALDVRIEFSNDGGKTYPLTASVPVSGDVGFPVMPGSGKIITCDLSALNSAGTTFTVRLVADDKQPFDLQTLVNEVDSNRLRADLQFVEGIRHRTTGAPHLNAVRDSLRQFFTAQGLYAEEHTFPYTGGYTGRNVLGALPGTAAADSVVIIDAHYDTVNNAPGADDNGSGTVGVMEIARLLSRYPTRKTARFIGFDLEESGLVGSVRYVTSGLLTNEKIMGALNFEMIGYYTEEPNTQELPVGFNILFPDAYNQVVADEYRGNFITNVGNIPSTALANLFASSAAAYVPGLKVITVLEPSTIPVPDLRRSDHAAFWGAGYPALMLTDGANFRNECYHTPHDTFENKLSFTFMANVVKATLATAAQLAEIQHGDWATTTFNGTVGAHQPFGGCTVSLEYLSLAARWLQVRTGACPLHDLQIELYDSGGMLVRRETLDAAPVQGTLEFEWPELSAGIYFVKINAREGTRTWKLALP